MYVKPVDTRVLKYVDATDNKLSTNGIANIPTPTL